MPGLQRLAPPERAVEVAGEDVGHEPVLGVVGAATASSSVVNVVIGATGPKISSCRQRASRGHVGRAPWAGRSGPGPSSGWPPVTTAGAPRRRRRRRARPPWPRRRARSAGRPPRRPPCLARPASHPSRSASRSANSSATEAATWKRLADVHASPMLRILAITAPSTAASRSASSNTRNGALPPSSIDTCSTRSAPPWPGGLAHLGRAREGELAEPLVLEERIDDRTRPTTAVTTLSTPLGRPASSRISARASIDSGVSCAGFTTIVQPAAIAGPILRVPIAIGKFHGVISRHGPTGWRIVSSRPWPFGTDRVPAFDAHRLLGEPAQELGGVGDLGPRARRAACPSRGSSAGRGRRRRSMISSKARRRISPRSRGGCAAHAACAATAASSAAHGVVGVAVGDLAEHLAGGRVLHGQRAALGGGRHAPPMNRPVGTSSMMASSSSERELLDSGMSA